MSFFDSVPDQKPKTEPDLYSYTVRYDDGAAPNPFYEMCTLAICKPGIRRTARPGDWVVGLGSASHHRREHMVYAMQVEQILSWQQYNQRAPTMWPHRLPDTQSSNLASHLGDCLYYQNGLNIEQRMGVHSVENRSQQRKQQDKDLNGHVLIATRFLYFGSSERPLIQGNRDLTGLIVLGGQGHRRRTNDQLRTTFLEWYVELENQLGNGQHGWPRMVVRGQCAGCVDHDEGEDEDNENLDN